MFGKLCKCWRDHIPSLPKRCVCGNQASSYVINIVVTAASTAGAYTYVECVWNVMAHAQKPDFVFRRNGRVHLNRRGRQFSRLLAAEVCASAVVMLDTPCSEVVWRVLATQSILQFPLHFPSRASPCAIRFQTHSTFIYVYNALLYVQCVYKNGHFKLRNALYRVFHDLWTLL